MANTNSRTTGAAAVAAEGGLRVPPWSYIEDMAREREQLYGTSGRSPTEKQRGTGERDVTPLRGRTFDLIARDLRRRRQLAVAPRIPRTMRKTTQVLRPGSSILLDWSLRLPALLAAKPMQVQCAPADERDEAQAASSLKEDFLHTVLLGREGQRALLDTGATSVWRDLYDNAVNTSRAAFLLSCRADRWSEVNPQFPRRAPGRGRHDSSAVAAGVISVGETGDMGAFDTDRAQTESDRRYAQRVRAFKQATLPFVLENVDPTSLHVREDEEGIEDEALVLAIRPYRETLTGYGLLPADSRYAHGADILAGRSGNRYTQHPAGLGRAYPVDDWPASSQLQDGVHTATYFCSARRAHYLGLFSADADVAGDGRDRDGVDDAGVWAHYVDGIPVAAGLLYGPAWHPLPLFRTFGLSTAMADPNFRGIPALYTLMDLADALDQIMTMEMHIAHWSAWPMLLEMDIGATAGGGAGLPTEALQQPEVLQTPQAARAEETMKLEPATFRQVPAGKKWVWLVLPAESTVHIERLKADVQGYLDMLGVPAALRGQGPSGSSGYHAALIQVAARAVYDPIVDNLTTTVQRACMYLLWQVWRRFEEGVPVWVGGTTRGGERKGWIRLRPQDIAPDWESRREPGTPFLACQVTADPLLPIDEMQLEQRGINAVAAGIIDEDTVRTHYFKDSAPEKTAARILGDQALKLPIVQESLAIRQAVRLGILAGELAVPYLAARLGLPPELALAQLRQIEALPPVLEAQMQAQEQAQRAIAAGGLAPGQEAVPGAPGVPGVPNPGLPVLAPTPPTPPTPPSTAAAGPRGGAAQFPIAGGPSLGGGTPTRQPTTVSRTVAALSG